ncbi:hypothetical protein [Ruegeria halocynthiae]|uniref:hypothetical protein n=1 Tax=Ruegeria halocynthiae TaxID=985054 RepID=UPI00055D0884|nr:hypothetical protein [Ruegeria halocynthiae]
MGLLDVSSFVGGTWIAPGDGAREIENAVTGEIMARAGNSALDTAAMLAHARTVGSSPAECRIGR